MVGKEGGIRLKGGGHHSLSERATKAARIPMITYEQPWSPMSRGCEPALIGDTETPSHQRCVSPSNHTLAAQKKRRPMSPPAFFALA